MSTYYLKFLGFPGNYEKGTAPCPPRAYIAIKRYFPIKWRDKKREIDDSVISADCVTFAEFQSGIDTIVKELETIKKQGKRFFKEDDKREAAMSSNHN